MLTSVNLREGVTLHFAAERSLYMRTLFGRRFVELREICSLGIGVGSEMAVDVESLRYCREGTQRVTAGANGFLRGDAGDCWIWQLK